MGTKDFNALDLLICRWRSGVVRRQVAPRSRLLDFGCGHQALFLRSVEDQVSAGLGLDYDATPARLSERIEVRNFRFQDRFDFADGAFDHVTILAVLEHIPVDGVDVLFREFRRILAPGGSVLITTPTPAAQPVLEFMAFKLRIISEAEIRDHRHYYTRADLESLAARHGFRCRDYRRFLFGFNCFAAFEKEASR